MIKTTTNQTRMLAALAEIYKTFSKNGDRENQEKMKQLIQKAQEQEVQLAFCGHFSAGKSSMINYLMGSQILPSSPIPTSANIVKVKQGEEAVRVNFFNNTHTIFRGSHDMKDIKEYCKDGEDIRSIYIYSEHFPLPQDCAVLDTPGIDSTDDAHRVSTESTLHLADLIFYVMDYNHVQSQENFLFAKKMHEAGKKLFLIVNQIDKHDSSELSFEQFKQSTQNSFAQWGINPEAIFYTSLRNLDLENNEIFKVQTFVHEQIEYERKHLQQSILTAAEHLGQDHVTYLQQQRQEDIEQANTLLSSLQEGELESFLEKLQNLQANKQQIEDFPEKYYLQRIEELNDILSSAYILTAESREIVKSFLESQQKNFKVGLFFAKSKTEAEKATREEMLLKELQERTKTQLEWHLRTFAGKCVKESKVSDHELELAAQDIQIEVPFESIKALVADQSEITGNYVLNFSKNISEAIKNVAKKQLIAYLERLKSVIEVEQQESLQSVEKEISQLEKYEKVVMFLQQLEREKELLVNQFMAILQGKKEENEQVMKDVLQEIENDEKNNEITIQPKKASEKAAYEEEEEPDYSQHVDSVDLTGQEALKVWSEKLTKSAEALDEVKGFTTIVGELKEKAERMKNQTYTIALFGAFSAGKSSFANALFGEKVLPVSPNPTTAVINKVMAPSGDGLHRTAKITLKSADMLLDDVKLACKALQFFPNTLDEAYEVGNKINEATIQGDGKEKAHLSFIHAFHKGYNDLKDKLGKEFIVNYDEYTQFAADESKSCFVDEIVLYFDCDLTRKGIVLVDTPGADSINARHTNAAFHYIKNSDAILFVTYYNHPFAKADREFLIQLGRVKDSFSMDKMFFICNAIDLAQNEEELQDVKQYIKGQLEGFGIRFPRLFPLSSKEALREQDANYTFEHAFLQNSGMEKFQQAFTYFIQHELIDLACSSAEAAITRAQALLHEIISAANASSTEKQERLAVLQREYNLIKELLSSTDHEVEETKLSKENDELIYYIHQRVFLRFSDFFKESFNPSIIKDDGRDLKEALRKCLRELLDSIGFDLEQEMRATSVRLESYTSRLVNDKLEQYRKNIVKIWDAIDLGEYAIQQYEVPEYKQAFHQLSGDHFKKELALFKNPKSFFENNDKQKMADSIHEALQQPAMQYLQGEGETAKDYYLTILLKELTQLQQHVERVVEDTFTSFTSVLQEEVDVNYYESKEAVIKQLLVK
ncbi:MAG: dynamin family protein [Bacillus sp. (in: firmicutes)]